MQETKHTPGPWEMSIGVDGAIVYHPDQGTIAAVPIDLSAHPHNARLICAAPELLEALEAVESWWFNGETDANVHMPHHVENMIRAAIARAKGVDRG